MNDQETASSNGHSTATRMIEGRRKDIETSVGKVIIRKLSLREIFVLKGGLIDVAAMATTEVDAEKMVRRSDGQSAKVMEAIYGMIRAGVVEPTLSDNPADGPTADDFGFEDQMQLCAEIMAFSGFSKEVGETVRPS